MARIIQLRHCSLSSLTKPNHPNYYLSDTLLPSVLQNYIDSNSPKSAQTIHSQIVKSGLKPTTTICIKLLLLHIKSGSLYNAHKVLDKMPEPTIAAFSYLISGYLKHGLIKEPLELVRRLTFSNHRLDKFTLSMVLKISSMLSLLNFTRQVHAHMVKYHFEPEDVLLSALIDSYVKLGKLNYAQLLFNTMSNRTVVFATSLIVGYFNEGLYEHAQVVFNEISEKDIVVYNAMIAGYSKATETAVSSLKTYKGMQKLGFQPNISSFVSVLGACSLLSDLDFGSQVHCQIIKEKLFSQVKAASALINFYSKCGCIEEARKIFDEMRHKNVISWTSMIDGYGRNGLPYDALKLFDEKTSVVHVQPNHATLLTVLSTCSHNGLVSEGRKIFQNMERIYLLKPQMEHYACMVDMFGRRGLLGEAYELIKGMKMKPSVDVWAALLSACRMHGNVEMAKLAAGEVFELSKNKRPGSYMAFSHSLADAGKWDGAYEVRELMNQRGVAKGAASSEVWS
ncbi:Pentatricopeptide repeat-containing protein [Rhynchospora pubera]|uniref:Pentatricopeptide repeat-containing protein n=1 Tax=Rhynchospora pubera TaxID=906938 RepID=A0AAV8D2B5_9POAL|nr:Pentatricopeptide repeat-containing protein [Rhynchospora pubera]